MKLKTLIPCVIICLLLVSCAHVYEPAKDCIQEHTYGFWSGLWHGIIAPFSFLISLWNKSVTVWAVNNNGNWYTFGFLLGVGAFTSSVSSSTKK